MLISNKLKADEMTAVDTAYQNTFVFIDVHGLLFAHNVPSGKVSAVSCEAFSHL